MSGLNYSDKIKRLGREYLVQTTMSELDNKIICSIFHEGQLLNNYTYPYPADFEDKALIDHVQNVHWRWHYGYDSLLNLVEMKGGAANIDLIIKLGIALYRKKLYLEGIDLLCAAADNNPQNSRIKMILGKIYLAKNQLQKAKQEFIAAVELSPDYPDYRNLLGVTYLKLEKALPAIEQFKKAVELNIYYYKSLFNLGLGYILNAIVKEDFEYSKNLEQNCKETFDKAVMFNPGFLNADFEKANKLLRENSLEDAYKVFVSIAERETFVVTEESQVEMYLRYIHGTEGMSEEGISEYIDKLKNLLKASPRYADLHNEMGLAYTILGKFMRDKAIGHFRSAIDINPDFSKALKNLRLSENELKGFEVLLEAIIK